MNDYTSLCMYILLGFPLFLVENQAFKLSKTDWDSLMTNNNKNKIRGRILSFDKASVLITSVCLIYLLWYFIERAPLKEFFGISYDMSKYIIYTSILIYFGFSLIRLMSFYVKKIKVNLYMILFVISLAPLLQLIMISSLKDLDDYDKIAIFCTVFVFFQHFFMDFILWSGYI